MQISTDHLKVKKREHRQTLGKEEEAQGRTKDKEKMGGKKISVEVFSVVKPWGCGVSGGGS